MTDRSVKMQEAAAELMRRQTTALDDGCAALLRAGVRPDDLEIVYETYSRSDEPMFVIHTRCYVRVRTRAVDDAPAPPPPPPPQKLPPPPGSWVFDDGGRAEAGFRGWNARDCVTRAIAIATGEPYKFVYESLNQLAELERPRKSKRSSSRDGVHRRTYQKLLTRLGWRFVPTLSIGSVCVVHLRADELPAGRIICSCSQHLVAVIDGVVHDTHDSTRGGTRCVYGYYERAD